MTDLHLCIYTSLFSSVMTLSGRFTGMQYHSASKDFKSDPIACKIL